MKRRFGFIGSTLGFLGLGLGFLTGGSGCSTEEEEPVVAAQQYTPAERNIVANESTSAAPLDFIVIEPGMNKNKRLVFVTGIDAIANKVAYESRENNSAVVEKTSEFNANTGVGLFDLGNGVTVSYRVNSARSGLQADVNRDGDIIADSLANHISIEGITIPLNGSFQIQPRTSSGVYWQRSEVPFPIVYTFLGLNAAKTAIVVKDDSDGITEFDLATGLITTCDGQHPFRVADSPDGPRLYVDLNADGDLGLDSLEGQAFITEEQKEIREGMYFYIGDATTPGAFPLVYKLKKINTLAANGANNLEFVDQDGMTTFVDYDAVTKQGTLTEGGRNHAVMVNLSQGYVFIDLDASGLIEQGRNLAANNPNMTAPRVSDESTIVQNHGYTFTKIPLGAPRLVIYSRDTATPPNHTMTDKNGAQALAFDQSAIPQATYTNPDGAQIIVYDHGAGVTGDWNANNSVQDRSNVTRR